MLFFFFKQKTAYEMRISDWSSDVCSSDLPGSLCLSQSQRRGEVSPKLGFDRTQRDITAVTACIASIMRTGAAQHVGTSAHGKAVGRHAAEHRHERRRAVLYSGFDRLEERRGGKEWVGPCRVQWTPSH